MSARCDNDFVSASLKEKKEKVTSLHLKEYGFLKMEMATLSN